MSENIKHAERVKELAGEYAHCYAFVKDETMPLKHAELHAAIDAMQSALDDAVSRAKFLGGELERVTEERNAAGEAATDALAKLATERKRGWDECMELWADHMKRMNEAIAKPLPDGYANHAHHIQKNWRDALDTTAKAINAALSEEVKGGC